MRWWLGPGHKSSGQLLRRSLLSPTQCDQHNAHLRWLRCRHALKTFVFKVQLTLIATAINSKLAELQLTMARWLSDVGTNPSEGGRCSTKTAAATGGGSHPGGASGAQRAAQAGYRCSQEGRGASQSPTLFNGTVGWAELQDYLLLVLPCLECLQRAVS